MMYIKFILGQIKILIMIFWSGIFVYPFFVYPNRKKTWINRNNEWNKQPFYFKYADTYETGFNDYNYLNSTYGIYELVKNENGLPDYAKFYKFSKLKKFILAYRWSIFRNGVWNYIVHIAPKEGIWENEVCHTSTGGYGCRTWRNKTKHGKQSLTWEVEGTKYFRYSYTKKFVGKLYINFMMGTGGSNNRNLIKLRIFKT